MKRCPTCQKEFADSMRFCQTDGTPLVEVAEKVPPPDPYKTVVGGLIKMDPDMLEIPPQNDPMKTMVSPISMPKADVPKSEPPPPKPASEPTFNAPPKPESKPQDPLPPKSNEPPSMSPPSFGGSSADSPGKPSSGAFTNEPPKSEPPPPPKNVPPPPPPFGASPFSNDPGKSDSPFGKSSNPPSSSPFDKPLNAPGSSPFDKTPPPPYKDPEPMFGGQQSPFNQPQTPFGQSNQPANQPFQQNEWAPPPAPVAGWQDQGLGANTPFQPPVAGGQNNTLAIVSLVCGIGSFICLGIFMAIPAIITGFMQRNNIKNNPAEYGGGGMAMVGMVLGGINVVLTVVILIIYAILIMANL